ncbi:MAG: hypothetical protein ACLPKE_01830 [Streptosporangiaceae bacterium]
MNTIRRIHHLAAILAACACALLSLALASPAMAMSASLPHPGPAVPQPQVPAQIHTVIAGGMPGWQITLIAAGAAVLTALLAVAADRAYTARRQVISPTL